VRERPAGSFEAITLQIAYYDESGDDGFPGYSSPLFVLTAIYLEHEEWKPIYTKIVDFRKTLKTKYGLPVSMEMHANPFLQRKKPFIGFGWLPSDRNAIVSDFCDFIATLNVKVINVVIVKPRVQLNSYSVLETALKYSVQRIENDICDESDPSKRFLIITDEGRVGMMRKVTRKIQRFNFIPSMYGPTPYRQEIRCLIEDPLPKSSRQSYYIQLADIVAYIIYLHASYQTGAAPIPKKLRPHLNAATVTNWMDRLTPSLNLLACATDPYGIVYHPN
jgi:hypothetical protein